MVIREDAMQSQPAKPEVHDSTLHELHDGSVVYGPPKSHAGIRFVHLPKPAMQEVLGHLAAHTPQHNVAPLFPASNGEAMRPRGLEAAWRKAREDVGREHIRFHDLRHFHLTMFATSRVTTAELMARAGHSSPRAALTYQHATSDRDRVLADALAPYVTPTRPPTPSELAVSDEPQVSGSPPGSR